MLIDVVMPQLGESVVEGVVVKWLVEAGRAGGQGPAAARRSPRTRWTRRSPRPSAGAGPQILVKPGETVPIRGGAGEDRDGSAQAAVPAGAGSAPEMGRGDGRVPRPHGAENGAADPRASARRAVRSRASAAPGGRPGPDHPGGGADGRRARAGPVEDPRHRHRRPGDPERRGGVPRVRRRSGAGVRPRLPRRPARGPPAPAAALPAPAARPRRLAEGDQVVPWTPIRKRIAEHMVGSKQTSPHVHIFAEVDMHRVAAHRARPKKEGVNLTYLPFVIHAAAKALREIPDHERHRVRRRARS